MYNSTLPGNNSFAITCPSSSNSTSIEEVLEFYGCALIPYATYLNATTIANFATKMAAPLWKVSPLVQNILSLVGLSTASVIVAPQVAKIYKEKNASGTAWGMVFLNIVSATVLLGFCVSATRIVDAKMLDATLGTLTLVFASLRVGMATSLIGMKIYYDNAYLSSQISSLDELIDKFYKEKKTIYSQGDANKDLESGNALANNNEHPKSLTSEVRNDVINKKKTSINSLSQKSLDNLMKIYSRFDQECPSEKKKKALKEKIQSKILELFVSGKCYKNSAIEIRELSDCMKKVKELKENNDVFNQFKVDFDQIENFDKILKDLAEYQQAKTKRSGGLLGAAHKFAKDIVPFCFGAKEQKLHEELSKNAISAKKIRQEFERDLKDFRASDNYKNLNENNKKSFDEVYNTIFWQENKENLIKGDSKIINLESINGLKEVFNQNQSNPDYILKIMNNFLVANGLSGSSVASNLS